MDCPREIRVPRWSRSIDQNRRRFTEFALNGEKLLLPAVRGHPPPRREILRRLWSLSNLKAVCVFENEIRSVSREYKDFGENRETVYAKNVFDPGKPSCGRRTFSGSGLLKRIFSFFTADFGSVDGAITVNGITPSIRCDETVNIALITFYRRNGKPVSMAFPRVALSSTSRLYENDRVLCNRHNANSRLRSLTRVWWRHFASYNDRYVQVNYDGVVKTERRFWRKVRYVRFCYFYLYFFILSFNIFRFVSGTYTTIAIRGNRREKIGRKPHSVSWVKYSSKSDRTENVLKYFCSWFGLWDHTAKYKSYHLSVSSVATLRFQLPSV